MKKFRLFPLFFLFFFFMLNFIFAKGLPHRKPAVAGLWYKGNKEALIVQLKKLFQRAQKMVNPAVVSSKSRPIAIVVPHAGYSYSGTTAAVAYLAVKNFSWKRVIILAPSHYVSFAGCSIPEVSAYDTPLGSIYLDRKICNDLLKFNVFKCISEAHKKEHSIEAQIPFIQYIAPNAKIVPILIGGLYLKDFDSIAKSINRWIDKDTLLVVSSDFTHYGQNYNFVPFTKNIPEHLKKWNMEAAHCITRLDFRGFWLHVQRTHDTICGRYPIGVAIKILNELKRKEKIKGELLNYTTSGALTGNWNMSVSYLAILFRDPPLEKEENKNIKTFLLTKAEKDTLLGLARWALNEYFNNGIIPNKLPTKFNLTPIMKKPAGVFVTLTKRGKLRGCIGYVVPVVPLYRAIIEMAINAAVKDYRFPPVKKSELKDLKIEISVLSSLKLCTDFKKIKVGKHGLYIQEDGRSGLLLPQVAVEWHWDRKTFLHAICRKAGLPSNAYLAKDALLYTFEAEVFHEK